MFEKLKANILFNKLLKRPNINKAYAMVPETDSWYDTIKKVHESLDEISKKPHEVLEINSRDNLKLKAVYYPNTSGNNVTVICVHGYTWYDETSFARDFVESCFLMNGEIRYYHDYRSPEYKQWKKETQKQKDKELREHLKKREIINETLLHDIESDRKYKERVKDIVDRDRLGFDENSFIGEFYHGQKRKKRVQ